jgi:hypothetical protein
MFAGRTKRKLTAKMCAQSIMLYKVKAVGTHRPADHCNLKASIISSYFLKIKFTNGNGNNDPYVSYLVLQFNITCFFL